MAVIEDLESGTASQPEVAHLPGCSLANGQNKAYHFEVTILLPPAPFSSEASSNGSDSAQTIAIVIPCAGTDMVSDLRSVVFESAEGFWLGSFALARVPAEDVDSNVIEPEHPASDQPAPVDGSRPDLPISNWTEVGTVFGSSVYADLRVPRILRVVDAPAEEVEVRTHVLRLRDVINNASSALVGREGYDPTPYDPSAPAIESGLSVYAAMRAAPRASAMPPQSPAAGPSTDVAIVNELEKAKKRRSHAKSKSRSRQANGHADEPLAIAAADGPAAAKPAPEPTTSSDPSAHAYADFAAEACGQQPLAALLGPREDFRNRAKPPAAVTRIALSVWNPPPPQLRLRGHLMYITVQLVEGATLSITATPAGYVVDQSDETHFNPTPRPPGSPYSSLFALLVAHSPRFEAAMRARFALPPITQPDAYASVALQNHAGAAPWLVDVPTPPAADALRHQLAYLATGSLGPANSQTQREWNDEFVAIRELPKSELNERILRDRLLAKLYAEYTAAAVRQVLAVSRGELAPINPTEPFAARTYVAQQILLLPAEDAHQAMAHMGGEEAVRVTVAKDVKAISLINAHDFDGLHTTGTVVVDFLGERWTAQALLPGLLGPARIDPDAQGSAEATAAPATTTGCGAVGCTAEAVTPPDNSGFRIVYGSEESENPDQSIAADERFHKLAEKVATAFHLALHTVKDLKGKASDLWLSSDVKGVLGTDGRSYLIDLYRLHCVDVCFLENDVEGKLYGSASTTNGVNGHTNGHADADTPASPADEQPPSSTTYPHRVVLLRPELTHVFRSEEFKRWIGESVAMRRSASDDTPATEPPKEEKDAAWQAVARRAHQFKTRTGKTTAEEAATSEQNGEEDGENAGGMSGNAGGMSGFWNGAHSIINLQSFGYILNPDAFVDRRPQPGQPAAMPNYEIADDDPDAHSSLMVRAASIFLRDSVIPELVSDLVGSCQVPQDGRVLTKQFHARGINMRYLGRFAEALDHPPEVAPQVRGPVMFALPQIKAAALREMLVRGAKHVYRRMLKALPAPEEAAPATSHFLNCLLGRAVNVEPEPDLHGLPSPQPSRRRTWSQLTPVSLQRTIVLEVQRRFRYTLPDSSFSSALWPVQFLREFACRVGLQLRLRDYNFAASTSTRTTVFTTEDIVNLVPVVKDTPHKTEWLDNFFDEGVNRINRGQLQPGEQQVTEALAHMENIYGSVHPELATRYHELAVVYHQLAQPLNQACSMFENAHADPSTHEERQKAKAESGLEDHAACEAARRECRSYVENAVRMNRQATIVCERCHGLDAYETLQYYIDLAILEHANDAQQFALKLSRHALALSTLISGPAHSDVQRILGTASQMLSAWQGHAAAVQLHRETVAMTRRARGPDSLSYAQTLSLLAKCLGNPVTRDYAGGLEAARESAAIFRSKFGADAEQTKEAEHLADQLEKAAAMKERSETGHVSRMARLLRTDESRVREIIAKNSRSTSGGGGGVNGASSKKLIANGADKRPEAATNGQSESSLAHLDIDELVRQIEGQQRQSQTKRRSVR